MNLGALDATQHGSTAQEYEVRGYPTIKYFAPGSSEPEVCHWIMQIITIVVFLQATFSVTPSQLY